MTQRITWEQFETYLRCPQWYAWDHLTKKPPARGQKDTQHLTRGNATQSLVDHWANKGHWTNPDWKFTQEEVRKAVIQNWLEDSLQGRPATTVDALTFEIQMNLEQTLPLLSQHINQWSGPITVTTQQDTEAPGPYNTIMTARLDLAVHTPFGIISYEGKATRSPANTKDFQVRWQADILGNDSVQDHYLVFYHNSKIKRVPCHRAGKMTKSHADWRTIQDEIIRRMVAGDTKATPAPFECRICNHRGHCPDMFYLATTEVTEAAKRKKVNVL